MSFANPGWLALLVLCPLILALHLRKKRSAVVSSVFLWKRVALQPRVHSSARLPKLSILLLLQLLVVVLIAFALAEPLLGNPPAPRHTVIILDASASMQATDVEESRFGRALERINEMVDNDRPSEDNPYTLIVADSEPHIASIRSVETEAITAAVARVQPLSWHVDWSKVTSLVSRETLPDETTRLVVFTDDHRGPERLTELGASMELALIGTPAADNLAFTRVAAVRLEEQPNSWEVSGAVGGPSAGSEAVIGFHFTPFGTERSLLWDSVQVELSEAEREFAVELEFPSGGLLELSLGDDALAVDNSQRLILLEGPLSLDVLHVGDVLPALSRALEVVPSVNQSVSQILPADSARFDLVFVHGIELSRHPGTHTVWVNTVPPGINPPERALSNPEVTGWRNDHPLAADVSWLALDIEMALQVERLPGAEVMLESAGWPLVQARVTDRGYEAVVAFQPDESNWPDLISFPAFIRNLVELVKPEVGQDVLAGCVLGVPCRVDPRVFGPDWELVGPDGEVVELLRGQGIENGRWLPRGIEATFRPQVAGQYEYFPDDSLPPFVVNADVDLGADIRVSSDAGSEHVEATGATRGRSMPVWAILILLVLVALLIETWLAGRTSERFLHLSALSATNPMNGRRRLMLGLRIAVLVFLVMAISGVPVLLPKLHSHTVLILDDAGRYPATGSAQFSQMVHKVAREADSAQQVTTIQIGAETSLSAELTERRRGSGAEVAGFSQIDLESSLRDAISVLSGEANGRILLVGDGSETQGNWPSMVPVLRERGIAVDTHFVSSLAPGEIIVEKVELSARTYEAQPFLVTAVLYSEGESEVELSVLRDGEPLVREVLDLQAGRNRIESEFSEDEPGTYLFEVQITSDQDGFLENNRSGALVEVVESPKVVIFTPQLDWGERFAQALLVQGLRSQVLSPDRIPYYLGHENPAISDWFDFDVAVLMNVPAIDLSFGQQELLERWVREFGGGLLVLGGENTFGPGGYYQTILEDVLPLSTEIPQERPSVAIAFVLDRSGSMRQAVGEGQRLDIAKLATVSAVELLDEESIVSVVAFDSEARALVPPQPAIEVEQLRSQLEPLQPGGGTSIYPGLELAFQQLQGVDEELTRHIVLMTDGLSQPGEFDELLAQIREEGITVSTAAIGRGADVRLIENIARMGGGAAHVTDDFQALPSILAQEALMLSDEPVQTETFVPSGGEHEVPFLIGIPNSLPPLHGHVMTTEKEGASTHLYAPEESPLLASWRYGLGRVVAFASHGAGPWSEEWLAMADYPRLWAQVVRWVLPPTTGPGMHLAVERSQDTLELHAHAVAPSGEVAPGLQVEGIVAAGDDTRSQLLVEGTQGQYVGVFEAMGTGEHVFQVKVIGDDFFEPGETAFHVAYPSRFDFTAMSPERLSALSSLTGGRALSGGEADLLPSAELTWRIWNGWPLWTLLALLLFMTDLLVRYAPRRLGLATNVRS